MSNSSAQSEFNKDLESYPGALALRRRHRSFFPAEFHFTEQRKRDRMCVQARSVCLGFEGKRLRLEASANQGRLAGARVGKWTTAFVEIFQTKPS